jgi:hypothetical protein
MSQQRRLERFTKNPQYTLEITNAKPIPADLGSMLNYSQSGSRMIEYRKENVGFWKLMRISLFIQRETQLLYRNQTLKFRIVWNSMECYVDRRAGSFGNSDKCQSKKWPKLALKSVYQDKDSEIYQEMFMKMISPSLLQTIVIIPFFLASFLSLRICDLQKKNPTLRDFSIEIQNPTDFFSKLLEVCYGSSFRVCESKIIFWIDFDSDLTICNVINRIKFLISMNESYEGKIELKHSFKGITSIERLKPYEIISSKSKEKADSRFFSLLNLFDLNICQQNRLIHSLK